MADRRFAHCIGPNCKVMAELCDWNMCGVCCRKCHSSYTPEHLHKPAPPLEGNVEFVATNHSNLPAHYGGTDNKAPTTAWGFKPYVAPPPAVPRYELGEMEELDKEEELIVEKTGKTASLFDE